MILLLFLTFLHAINMVYLELDMCVELYLYEYSIKWQFRNNKYITMNSHPSKTLLWVAIIETIQN